jgi:predicted O-linked N-acetylglucosamine transferase (SPINDLY family)
MAGIVDGLDRRRFRPTVVAVRAAFGEIGRHLQNRDVELVALPQRFDLATEQIRAASFDALYFWEVGTDATNYFLPFCRMAPLQVTGWGWPETSGAPALDFHLTSAALAPPGAERLFTEPLARLPHLPAFPRLPPARPRPERPERFGLPKGARVYFCAQNLRKVHFDMDPMLAGILGADPAAVAVFIDDKSPVLGELLRRRWRAAIGEAAERLIVLPRLPPDDYITLLASSHVVVDTPHFAGSNTAYDALIAGAPVVTLPGVEPRSRYTAALHESAGITELTAASAGEYVEIAVRVANDQALRRTLGERLRSAVPVAFENPQAVRQLEDFLSAELELRAG